ncbi:MAG TPA: alcohol dehydrogenase catalytic domain-containing protein [Planctomycetota bacterium]|jgi:threonine dehydrogenase-like Zn-dependent dehydrogenase
MAEAAPSIPKTEYAVQLIGPSKLTLNREKPVVMPGPTQVLAKVEAVGLCFSDLKLLKQFNSHVRKVPVVRGIDQKVLSEIPSYVPNEAPTVPGHEVCCRIVAVGSAAKHHKVGERCLVQTDYRTLRTAAESNAAFGYNFEGGLQEYVLMDERVIMEPASGERFLIPVSEKLSASAIALVEPWACVENSYATAERQTIKAGGKLLVVADAGRALEGVQTLVAAHTPASITAFVADDAQKKALSELSVKAELASGLAALPDESFDDIIYFGKQKQTIELLNDKLGTRGIINIVLGGLRIGAPVSVGIGRVHYRLTRWIGTTGTNAASSYSLIPANGELRAGEKMLVIGAGGPMGQMHVIRAICSGLSNVSVCGTDMDDGRIAALAQKAVPLAKANGVSLRLINTQKEKLQEKFSYFGIMAPVGAIVAAAIKDAAPGALINVFAGIPAPTRHDMDLDTYIQNGCFMFGTSGSVLSDMKTCLRKLEAGRLDTDCSVDAISGMAGAADGIAAVENRTLAGKIIVYPMLHELGLIPLGELSKRFPTVAEKLQNGVWCKEAEEELLRVAAKT